MVIALGSTSEDKKRILLGVLSKLGVDAKVLCVEVDPRVPDQPLDEGTTILGARNRSRFAKEKMKEGCAIGMGLEGGLTRLEGDERNLYLVCVAVITDSAMKDYIGVSSKLCLPRAVSEQVQGGRPFGHVIRDFANSRGGDFGLAPIISSLVRRETAFAEAINNCWLVYNNRRSY